MLEKIKEILEDILDEELDISLDTKFEDLEDWDSLALVTFAVTIENEFDKVLDMETLIKCETIKEIMGIIDGEKK